MKMTRFALAGLVVLAALTALLVFLWRDTPTGSRSANSPATPDSLPAGWTPGARIGAGEIHSLTIYLHAFAQHNDGRLPDSLETIAPQARAAGVDPERLASYVYLGDADVVVANIAQAGRTVVVHEPVKGREAGRGVVVGFLDGSSRVVSQSEAEQLIAESKLSLQAAKAR